MNLSSALRKQTVWSLGLSLFVAILGCRDSKQDKDEPGPPRLPLIDMEGAIGGTRPVEVKTPPNYDPASASKYPLLVLLHGYGSDAPQQDSYLSMSAAALARGYIFIAPNGTTAPGSGKRFWNAGEICCNFENSPVDDVAYLRDLIRQVSARYAVDPARVYLFGHSNGAFMALRFACDQAPWITAIAGLAGSLRSDPKSCQPERPVGVLTIHGTADDVILYEGGQFTPQIPPYPSADATIARWAEVNACSKDITRSAPFTVLAGSQTLETTANSYAQCAAQGRTELWRIEGGAHVPAFDAGFVPRVLDFFETQRR